MFPVLDCAAMSEVRQATTARTPVAIQERKAIRITPGDTVRVWQKIEEKGKTRLQAFEGLVIAVKHGKELGGTFTVRRVSGGYGVERIFPLFSPLIDRIEVLRRTKVRRAKLYFVRDKTSKALRRLLRRTQMVSESTVSEQQRTKEEKEAAE
ncbi:MAG: 50S ribosomal protein L19 [Candidatus Parcubacteria bacterium]|nr:MAG: 50S ribosomal protein L19 [Candidatus Parcubacteria bacterium]